MAEHLIVADSRCCFESHLIAQLVSLAGLLHGGNCGWNHSDGEGFIAGDELLARLLDLRYYCNESKKIAQI